MNNHNPVRIIVDSSTDMASRYCDQVVVVPLTVMFGEEEYRDGIDLSRDEFYRKLEEGKELPTTSQATPAAFEEAFSALLQRGEEGLVITMSSELSGTYASACMAAEPYPEIRVVDGRNVTVGTGILAEYALGRAAQGVGLEELAAEVEEMRAHVCVLAKLDTLEYLVRGGRISKTVGFAGGLLNVKPVITIEDGLVNIVGKARGPKKADNLLVKRIEENGINYDLPILLGYTGTSDELLQDYMANSRALWEGNVRDLECAQICSVIGTHAGPGVVAVAFFKV